MRCPELLKQTATLALLFLSSSLLAAAGSSADANSQAVGSEVEPTASSEAAAVATPMSADDAQPLPDLTELLSIEGEYTQTERCLATHKMHQVKVLDESHIVFRLRGQRYFIAQLERRCYGLEKNQPIAYDLRSGRLCAMDRVRGVPLHGGATAACQLPRFQPVSKEQVVLLREALREANRK